MVLMFKLHGSRLFCSGRRCVPSMSVSDVLKIAHDSKVGGHLKIAKTLSRLSQFHWKNNRRDFRKYCESFLTFQQYKDSNQSKLTDPMSLKTPTWR